MPNEPAALIEPTLADLDGLLALSAAAHWNQTRDDWIWMLGNGRTRALREHNTLVASTLVLPWPAIAAQSSQPAHPSAASLAWVSMVLVLPQHRGKGHATRLLEESLAWLLEPGQRHLLAVLDATPAGRPVYLKLGFADQWGFTRWEHRTHRRMPADRPSSNDRTRLDSVADQAPALHELDRIAFGADRSKLLDDLMRRAPSLALIARSGDLAHGFILARPGRVATQLGPLVARDFATAIELAEEALSRIDGAVFIDIPDSQREFGNWLASKGFVPQRPFMRMALSTPGHHAQLGTPITLFAVAGPELG